VPGANASKPIVVVGDVIVDVIVRPRGARAPDSDTPASIERRPGGSGANVAAWLGQLGAPVRFAGRAGAADRAERAAELAAAGVDVRLAADPDRPTGAIVVVVGEDGERAMFTDRGANEALTAGDLPPSLLDGAALLHVSGYALFAPGPRAAALGLMAAAIERGIPISVDCASESFLRDASEFADWIAGATVCFANADEAAVLTGQDDPAAAAAVLAERHAVVALKRGGDGAIVTEGVRPLTERGQTPSGKGSEPVAPLSLPAVAATLVDPTGAGDAFCAGFLARWVGGADLAACAHAALETAAAAIAQPGGRPTPSPG